MALSREIFIYFVFIDLLKGETIGLGRRFILQVLKFSVSKIEQTMRHSQ